MGMNGCPQLLQRLAEGYLHRSPEEATSFDYDTGANASLRSQLDDRSLEAIARHRTAVDAAIRDLRQVDRAALGPAAILDYDVALFVYDDLAGSASALRLRRHQPAAEPLRGQPDERRLLLAAGVPRLASPPETQADLNIVIANALDLVDHKLKAFGIDVEYRRHRGKLAVMGNPIHLEQVLINLIANAADAMEHSPIRVLSIGVGKHERSVEISVADTGSGIAAEELANLFDPFYSTKEAGRGLGLGLSISYGLVRDIGGAISVESRPGKGSTFTVRLPLAGQSMAALSSQLEDQSS